MSRLDITGKQIIFKGSDASSCWFIMSGIRKIKRVDFSPYDLDKLREALHSFCWIIIETERAQLRAAFLRLYELQRATGDGVAMPVAGVFNQELVE